MNTTKNIEQKIIFHCDLDAFFASVELVLHPELKGKPVIVGGDPRTRGIVACPSYEARALGIRTAMPLKQAYRIAPQAIFLHGNFSHYRQFSENFFKILGEYTDGIEVLSLDEAYLDVTMVTSWNAAESLAEEIRQRIKNELGLHVSIGIGTSKTVAKIASDAAKPNGVRMVLPGTERTFLGPLPTVAMPGIGKNAQLILQKKGVHTIGDLAALSENRILAMFGWRGTILQDRARGIDDRKVYSYEPIKSLGHARTFERDIAHPRVLRGVMSYLLEKTASRLRQHERYATVVKITIRYADFTTISKQFRLKHPTDDQRMMYTALEKLFSMLYSGRPVRLVGVTLAGLIPNPRQEEFAFSRLIRIQKIQRAVDTLRERFGFDVVLSGSTIPVQRALLLHQ